MLEFFWATAIALLIDAAVGWPAVIYSKIGHPVTWIGSLITKGENYLNHGSSKRRFVSGIGLTVIAIVVVFFVSYSIVLFLKFDGLLSVILLAVFIWPWLSVKSLYQHVAAVAEPLSEGNVENGREAVAMIVGRNTKDLDEAGISRASIESLAENTSDGVFAPVFWALLFGLPGIAVYKTVNTLDSMIGYRNDRYEYFGKFAAKLDDLLNFIPARICAIYFAIVSGDPLRAFRFAYAEAKKHRSPNAGWPEAAMAFAANVRLSGPRIYDNHLSEEEWVNNNANDPKAEDIYRCLKFYVMSIGLLILTILTMGLLVEFL